MIAWVTVLSALWLSGAGVQDPLDSEVAGLISVEDLAGTAAEIPVTVLYRCQRAEAVSASATVSRSFDREIKLRMQPDSRSNAIFVTGQASVVKEAIARLEALDESTPEKPQPVRRQKTDPAKQAEDFASNYSSQVESLPSSGLMIVGGVIGAIFILLVVSRRMFR